MAFVKVVKNKAYYKRYQVKYRRRREGKTDFYARRRLVAQDKNKYNSKKYRMVVRITNKDVVTQIVYSELEGDVVMCAAYAHELPRYGLKVGLTNYAAVYCTGLLLARRHLAKLGLADTYKGNEDINGEEYFVEREGEGARPFYAILDTGLARTSTGARVFAALKGACDGGLDIPHNEKRFAGYDSDEKSFSAEILRKYIFGGHVADYMTKLEATPEAYNKQFSRFKAAGVNAGNMEALYQKVHAAIRADPAAKPTVKKVKEGEKPKSYRTKPLSYQQRKDKIRQKKEAFAKKQASE
mmetsp:Transcript_13186/g.24350  ORF Transcript_13186/g.24350 Transcript_13186/m.24350 type:complete len:297 (-) Transcript_13186:33-923(-)